MSVLWLVRWKPNWGGEERTPCTKSLSGRTEPVGLLCVKATYAEFKARSALTRGLVSRTSLELLLEQMSNKSLRPILNRITYNNNIIMTKIAKRDWKEEYRTQLSRGDDKGQLERQKARRLYDKKGINREGKNIDHILPIKSGGMTKAGNLRLRSPKANKSDNKK